MDLPAPARPARHRRIARCWVALLWACFVLRATFYACVLPLWEGFDEYAHYARVECIATSGREPLRSTPVPADVAESMKQVPTHNGGMRYDEFWKLADQRGGLPRPAAVVYEAQQPPLFYWLFAALYRLIRGGSLEGRVIVLRLGCLLVASSCVPLGFLIARRTFANPALALGATTLTASLPLATFSVTHVSNDALAAGLGGLVVLLALERRSVPLALALGMALLTKAYFLAFLPPIGLLLLQRGSRKAGVSALAGAMVIAGWWYWMTWTRTGSLTGNVILVHPSLGGMAASLARFDWGKAADSGWTSFVWIGNWSFLPLRSWMYHATALLAWASLAGVVRLIRNHNTQVAFLSAFLASFAMALAYFAVATFAVTGYPAASGWYSVCLLAPIAIVLFAGLHAAIPDRWKPSAGPSLVTVFLSAELFGTHIYLLPYYAGFISHGANGGLPALRIAQLRNGRFSLLFERLDLHKPGWLPAGVLMALWLLFVFASMALIAASFKLAGKERGGPERDDAALRWN